MKCNHWMTSGRCQAEAVVQLIEPDGEPNPGGYFCQEHGEMIVSEYQVGLGETWTLKPLIEKGVET